jgi:hypothetical protein
VVLTDRFDTMFPLPPKKNLHLGRRIDADSPICSLGHCECDGHTVYKLSKWHLTADLLAPRESDCSRMHSNVSSDRMTSYVKATRPVSRDIQNGWILSGQASYVTYTWFNIRFLSYKLRHMWPVSICRIFAIIPPKQHDFRRKTL